jgi:H+/gluconate symporter-like permease
MNLIDKYIERVGDNLPRNDREDILKEIRSILEDTLESRSEAENRPVDEELTISVLKDFGTPTKVAASYLPPRFLIGPRLYPTFLMITKIILGIVLLVGVVVTSVALFQQPYTIETGIEFVLKKLLEIVGSMLSVFGNIVFVFAIVEWALSKAKPENEDSWDPNSLKDETDRNTIKPLSQVPDILLTVFALVVFNIFANKFGAYFNNAAGQPVFIPALSPVFYTYLPWINVIWVLGLILNIILIRTGKWQTWTRVYQIVLDVLSIIILVTMATGQSIITEAAEKIIALGPTGSQIAGIYVGLGYGMKALLIVLVVVTIVDTVQEIIKLIRNR